MDSQLVILSAVIVAALVGAVVATIAILLGMQAGVRARQGMDPLPGFRSFLENHVASREATARVARDGTRGAGAGAVASAPVTPNGATAVTPNGGKAPAPSEPKPQIRF